MTRHLLGTRPCTRLCRAVDELELVGLAALTVLRISGLWQNGFYSRDRKCHMPWQVISMREGAVVGTVEN